MPDYKPIRPETTCARPPREPASATQPLAPSLHPSVVYRVDSLDAIEALNQGAQPGFTYARDSHPNLIQLGEKVAQLEAAESAWACSSGMAVESLPLLALLQSGDNVAVAHGVYGKTARLVAELQRFGVTSSRFDAAQPDSLEKVVTPRTRLVVAETLSNPLVYPADIAGLASVAEAHHALLLIDNTFSPLLVQPLRLGAHLVTHSATKYLGGHSDLTLGVIAAAAALVDRLAGASSIFGFTANPYECWLCLRGMATLALRFKTACRSAHELAQRLEQHERVQRVFYPGLASHPGHDVARSLLTGGFGAMMTIDLGSRAAADHFIRALRNRIPFAPSLGDVATTLSHPATTSHRCLSEAEWAAQGITPGLVRLSIGIEDVEDLWHELDSAASGREPT